MPIKPLVLATTILLLIASCSLSSSSTPVDDFVGELQEGERPPALPSDTEWVNLSTPVGLDEFVGTVTLVYFWTASCLPCLDVQRDADRLAAEFPGQIEVLGIHSGKFPAERSSNVIAAQLARSAISHPVVNDRTLSIWQDWGITAWPTVAVLDATGEIRAGHVGSGAYDALKPAINRLVEDSTPAERVPLGISVPALPPTILSFPEGIAVDTMRDRIFIADTNHHRLVITSLDGEVISVIGSGSAGRSDGPAESAEFFSPRGLTVDPEGTTLYVADSGNHLVRTVDLPSGQVVTLVGTGEPGEPIIAPLDGPNVSLHTPWDIALDGDTLYVSVAGVNQIWRISLSEDRIEPIAGTGREGSTNGPALESDLARPAGLALEGGVLYFADADSSSIGRIDLGQPAHPLDRVAGPTGSSFEFGDLDALGAAARFQRPLGIAADGSDLWIIDTYNSKIKQVDPHSGSVQELVGGKGWRDGPSPLFSFPADVASGGGRLFIADTGNHSVRIVDPRSGSTSTLILNGIERLEADDGEFDGTYVELDPVAVGAGPGRLVLTVSYPDGYKANPLTPSRFEWSGTGDAVAIAPNADRSVEGPVFPISVGATFEVGDEVVRVDLYLAYCEDELETICLFDRVRLDVPVRVESTGPDSILIPYSVTLPDLLLDPSG